jgi:hypothetical protein
MKIETKSKKHERELLLIQRKINFHKKEAALLIHKKLEIINEINNRRLQSRTDF